MLRKRLLAVLLGLSLALGFAAGAFAAPLAISVCGEGANESDDMAMLDAYCRAVKKAVINFITTESKESERNAIFAEIARNPQKYIVGKAQIIKRYKKDGKAYAVCKVPVDLAALEKFVNTRLKAASEKIAELGNDNHVFFFVRVTGNIDQAARGNATGRANGQYAKEFANLGFLPARADELAPVIQRLKDSPESKFIAAMEKELHSLVSVSFAVVGEIAVAPGHKDAFGETSAAKLHIVAYDLRGLGENGDKPATVIADFTDRYELKRSAQEGMMGANSYVIDKAAYNSAHYIAGKIYEYWRNNH